MSLESAEVIIWLIFIWGVLRLLFSRKSRRRRKR